MAINKKLIHFNKKSTFNSQKLSANDSNTQYRVGGTGTVQTGAPDINYQSIVYIKDSKEIWTHGQFYATAVTWSTITGKPSFATVATSGSYNDLNNKPTIPTKLPTPNALTFTGAVTGTWDGSSAKTVNIPSGSSYTLPLASNSTRGGIKLSSSTQGGTPNGITTTSGRTYAVQVNSSEQAVVNVPWTDTRYSLPTASNSTRGGIKLSSSTQGGTPNGITTTSGRTYAVQVNSSEQAVVNVPWTDTRYSLPTASATTLGGVKVGSGLAISNGVLSATGGREADSVAWGNVTGKPSWIGSSKSSYSWPEITSKPTLVKQVEPGTPSRDWQSAYVPLDVTYSDTSISHKIISLPMASPASGSSQGSAGLITGVDKKKLDDFTDTKNTAGATNSTNRLYLIGATSQGANPQTYSKNTVYIEDDGILMSLQGFEGGAITSTAAIYAANGFFDTSDARVKTNVVEIDASKADAVRLVEFDRTDKKHHGYGVIAQELEKVYPEMVNTDSEGFKSVNYNELAMVKIKYLEDKVARLEALVGRLLAE